MNLTPHYSGRPFDCETVPVRTFSLRCKEIAKAHKRAHDGDVHFDGLPPVQDAGEHGHALLGESIDLSENRL
jgi:hypothetical protein